jgi:hypothetical protein
MMKRTISIWISAVLFVTALGLVSAFATPVPAESHRGPAEITGCLQQGPTAREYLIQSTDGSTWGLYETRDMMLNDYIGRTVTVSGDVEHLSASARKSGAAEHYLRAMDLVVESESCRK